MNLFYVDEKKCKKDGICAAECPLSIIDFENKDDVPKPYAHMESICINCGHCVAVCPHGALTHKNMSPDDCLDVDNAMALDIEQSEYFLRQRRSIRNYKSKPVEKPAIEKLLSIAAYAPSGHNTQPVQWQVLYGQDKVKQMSAHVIDWMIFVLKEHPKMAQMMHFDMITQAWKAGMDVVTRSAPALVLANGGAKDPFADNACKIALTFFDLAVPAMGLGSCWCGYFNRAAMVWEPLKEALGLSKELTNYGTMMLGYPKFSYSRMPTRNAAKIAWLA